MKRLFTIFLSVTLCAGLFSTAMAGSFQTESQEEQSGFSAVTESDDPSDFQNSSDGKGFTPEDKETTEDTLLTDLADLPTESNVPYLTYDSSSTGPTDAVADNVYVINSQSVMQFKTDSNMVLLSQTDPNSHAWYMIQGDVTLENIPLQVQGNVNLILADNCHLTINESYLSIYSRPDSRATLNIYAQSAGNAAGRLSVSTDTTTLVHAIGGNTQDSNLSTLNIYGGQISAISNYLHSDPASGQSGIFLLHMNVYGGTVYAKGLATGINLSAREQGCLTIYGGSVTAEGNQGIFIDTTGETFLDVKGGTLDIIGTVYGIRGNQSQIDISGGIVKVTVKNGPGIDMTGPNYTPVATVNASLIMTGGLLDIKTLNEDGPLYVNQDKSQYSNCIHLLNNHCKVYGDATLPGDYKLEETKILNVPEGTSLTIPEGVTLTVEGTLNINGSVQNNGTIILMDSGQINGTLTGNQPVGPGVTLDRNSLSLTTGNSTGLTASLVPANSGANITWTSNQPSVATVSGNGTTATVTAVSAGTATITATATMNGATYTATCTVSVSNPYYPVTGISVTPSSLELEKGNSAALQATVTPSYASNKTVTWTSSDPAVATVSRSGVVTAVGAGTATITAQAGSYTASCTVTVTVPITGITLNQSTLGLSVGEQGTLMASVEPADADQTVTWTSDNPAVASVDASGTVTGVSKGTAVITATTSDGAFSASCTVTVPGQPASTGLSVGGRTTSSVTLSWDAVEEAEGYTIWYRSEYETSVTRKIIWDGDSTTWTKTGLKPGTKYFFAIRSWVTDADGNYVFSKVSPTQRGTTKPEAAQIQSVDVTNGYVKVRLTGEAEGAKRYSLCYASSSSGFTSGDFQVGIRTSYTTRTMTEPLSKGTWYVRVKSYRDLGNNKRIYGDWSNVVRITVE